MSSGGIKVYLFQTYKNGVLNRHLSTGASKKYLCFLIKMKNNSEVNGIEKTHRMSVTGGRLKTSLGDSPNVIKCLYVYVLQTKRGLKPCSAQTVFAKLFLK